MYTSMCASERPPKVFVSYSWDDEFHKSWVRELAARLRADGVEVVLDQWHVRPGDQLPAFMERAIRENDFVLIVCTPLYKAKSEGRIGGVGYEGNVIQGEVFVHGNDRKFIPLLRRGSWTDSAPTQLSGKVYISFTDEAEYHQSYRKLVRTLHSGDPTAPAVGRRPEFSPVNPPLIPNRDLRGHEHPVEQVGITGDGTRIVSIDDHGQLRVWDSATGACLRVLSAGKSVHTPFTLNQSGTRALALTSQGYYPPRITAYSLDSGQPTITLVDDEIKFGKLGADANYVTSVTATVDWSVAVTGSTSGELAIWDVDTAAKVRAIQAYDVEVVRVESQEPRYTLLHLVGGVSAIRLLRDSTKAITLSNRQNPRRGGDYDSQIKVWSVADGKLLRGVPPPGPRKVLSYGSWTFENDFLAMCVTRDESNIVTVEKAGTIKLWDLETGDVTREWQGKSSWRGIVESCQNSLLISVAGTDPDIMIWDYTNGRLLDTRRYHSGSISSLCASADGQVMITGSADNTVRIRKI